MKILNRRKEGRVPPPGEPVKGERTVETIGDAPHSGVREALLAPVVAPALPDVARSSSAIAPRMGNGIILSRFAP
jgi:hypothetical protein